jgi:hypothetical protein
MRPDATRTLLLVLLLACGGVVAFWSTMRDPSHAPPGGGDISHERETATSETPLPPVDSTAQPQAANDPVLQPQPQPVEPDTPVVPQRGVVTGRVVDSGGRGLACIAVLALGPDLKLGRGNRAQTDADGRYRIEFAAGPCRLIVETSEFSVIAAPGEVEVTGGETIADDFVLGRPVTVKVRLLDATGAAMTNKDRTGRWLRVTGVFVSANGNSTRLVGEVDAEGTVLFAGVPLDAAEFTLNAIGYVQGPPTNLHLVESIQNDLGELRLTEMETAPPPPSGSVRGRVVDPDGRPLSGVVIFAHRTADKDKFAETYRSDDRTTSDDDGIFHLSTLEVGEWYFIVASSEYTVRENPGSVTVIENTETVIADNFVLGPPTALKLRLVDENGTPLAAGVRVTAAFGQRGPAVRLVRDLEADGIVLIKGAPAAATEVTLSVPGYEPSDTLRVALREGELTDGGELKLATSR